MEYFRNYFFELNGVLFFHVVLPSNREEYFSISSNNTSQAMKRKGGPGLCGFLRRFVSVLTLAANEFPFLKVHSSLASNCREHNLPCVSE
jgi:hypothetical protein